MIGLLADAVLVSARLGFPIRLVVRSRAGDHPRSVLFGDSHSPGATGPIRAGLTAAVLLTVAVDYKVFGTSKWFDADEGVVPTNYGSFPAMRDAVFHTTARPR